jgi:hypothetical protein
MKLARLYIPKYPNAPVAALERRLVDAFGGYTTHSMCVGVWKNPAGQITQEPVYVYDVVIGAGEHDSLSAILDEYKKEAEQEAVLYVIDNQPIFI